MTSDHHEREIDHLEPHELVRLIGTESEPYLLDVREPDEVAAWSIAGAVNIPLGQLSHRSAEIPTDRHVVVLCASGSRSRAACRSLARDGLRVSNLAGGMRGWSTVYDEVEIQVGGATVIQIRRRAKGCLSYLVGSENEALAVDPSLDIEIYTEAARRHRWDITRVVDTHLHADHLSGARLLASATGASLHLNPADTFHFPYEPLADQDRFVLPGGVEISVSTMHTPGHTEGSTVLMVAGLALLTGDTLFVDGVGRPDLAERAEEFARNLYRSLTERVLGLPGDAVVLPGHHSEAVTVRPDEPVAATLAGLREDLPALSYGEEEFVAWATSRSTQRPPHYVEIIHANMGRPRVPEAMLRHLEAGPNRCSA
ncbi:MAG: MBL fold metallo-hydrolase [Acidimicrobiales bacterium]